MTGRSTGSTCALLLAVAIAGCSPSTAERSKAPSPSPSPAVESPFVPVFPGPALGAAPATCPRPSPRLVTPGFGPAVGDSPVFAAGWDTDGVLHVSRATLVRHGEERKILWFIAGGFTHPVALHGANVKTSAPLYFEVGGDAPTTRPVLYPGHPGAANDSSNWPNFPSYLDIPTAGCYRLEADWPGGHWQLQFPAGD